MKSRSMMELVKEATTRLPDKIPKGFKTREQWGSELNMDRCKMQRALKKLVEQGAVEIQLFWLAESAHRVPHYKEK